MSEVNRQLISSFLNEKISQGCAPATIYSYTYVLQKLDSFVKKSFRELEKEDLVNFLRNIREILNGSSIQTFKMRLKTFFRWLGKEKDVEWIRISKKYDIPDFSQLPTKEEILEMVRAADHVRDKAMVYVLYEGALRESELINIKVGDVILDEYGAVINVREKTGVRTIQLVESVPYLVSWMNVHPYRDDANAPLFLSRRTWTRRKISRSTLKYIIKVVAKRAKIKKNVYPHLLRHKRLTELANYLREMQLKVFAGWSLDSRMASIYVKKAGVDTSDAILGMYGLKVKKEEKREHIESAIAAISRTLRMRGIACNVG
ncbi:MAG: tyrosine-type recombinase/integrase [Candidatus Asgardarchaeia archaeon]